LEFFGLSLACLNDSGPSLLGLESPGLGGAIAFLCLWLAIWIPFAIPIARWVQWRPGQEPSLAQKLPLLISLYCLVPPLLWGTARLQGVPLERYGLNWQLSQLPHLLMSLGLGIGMAIAGLIVLFGLQLSWGWYCWQGIPWQQGLKAAGMVAILAGFVGGIEEWVFRGFIFYQLTAVYAPGLSAAIASLIFALMHLIWFEKGTYLQLPGLWLMGITLCIARWVDQGSLGLAWGLHSGWVWGLATLEMVPLLVPVLNPHTNLPVTSHWSWLAGRQGKPLAGMMGLLLLLATAGGLWSFGSNGL
jgi:uncharacterized protein